MYLTWGETPRSYGIYKSQVINQFIETKNLMDNDDFYFISAIPVIHSGLVREKFKYFNELKKVKEELKNIKFEIIPIYAPQNLVNSNKLTFKLMHFGSQYHLFNKIRKIDPDIIHCRSYHSAWAAQKVREKYNFNYKIIFDGRGLWPEEVSFKKNYTEDNKNYRYLKNIEKKLLESSDISIVVSDTMEEHYKKLNVKKVKCIYLSANTSILSPTNIVDTVLSKKIHFCYIGAISNDTWHQLSQLIKLYNHLRSIFDYTTLTIVTTSNHKNILQQIEDIPKEEIKLVSTKSVEELKNIIQNIDIGLLPYRDSSESLFSNLIGNTMLGTKTVEYLSAGLPVLVNNNCGGASMLIDKFSLGISYSPNTFVELTKNNILRLLSKEDRKRYINISKKLFDYQQNALKYKNIYQSLK
jgi:glycosyltransferase involved in cell wall biosynthesis